MLYPWRIWKWECIFRFASTKVLQSTQMLGLPFLLVMIMGREAWWRWRWRCRFIGDDNDDEEEDCIGDFCICENFQGCQVHWGDQEFVAGVHHKSLPISSARGEYSSPSAQYIIHLCTWFSPPDSPHLALSTFTWLFPDLSRFRLQWRSLASTPAPLTGTRWSTRCREATMWSSLLDFQVITWFFF